MLSLTTLSFVLQIFLGNLVANVAVKHRLIRPITARYVRFEAKEFLVRICMRIELYGEKVDDLNVGKTF